MEGFFAYVCFRYIVKEYTYRDDDDDSDGHEFRHAEGNGTAVIVRGGKADSWNMVGHLYAKGENVFCEGGEGWGLSFFAHRLESLMES